MINGGSLEKELQERNRSVGNSGREAPGTKLGVEDLYGSWSFICFCKTFLVCLQIPTMASNSILRAMGSHSRLKTRNGFACEKNISIGNGVEKEEIIF